MSRGSTLSDAEARSLGETTFDRNVVVLAGAGTGKTTLLVNRLLHALLREPQPFRLTEILVLTFTNKAAHEMKARLHEKLRELLEACQATVQNGASEHPFVQHLHARYLISTPHIQDKVLQALDDLEQAQITTLHSFAAHVLRLYPLESGIDPSFQGDDGSQFVKIFSESWERWLDKALGRDGTEHAQWQEILEVVDLKEIQECAWALCDDQISLPDIHQHIDVENSSPTLILWLKKSRERISHLLEEYGVANPRKIEKMLGVAECIFDCMLKEGCVEASAIRADEKTLLDSAIGQKPKGWAVKDFQEARRLVHSARRLVNVDHRYLKKIVDLLEPFVSHVRGLYADSGWIRFDGLLVHVRNVLRDFPRVREQLKTDFRTIMVDECQDTDPLQYEILLYLGEQLGEQSPQWEAVRLAPGKLFIVGDPKQSIYAFRRADIQAFEHVVQKLTDDGGLVCTLTTNFRSDPAVLNVVNAVFDQLFVPEEHVQPPNVSLVAGREEEALPAAGVELYVIAREGDEEWDAERATRVEAEWLAAWLQEQLTSRTPCIWERGIHAPLRPGHVAVLFRKFTNAHVYLEAMHRRGVPYLTDGERHFYRRQEVIDLVNVLRVLDDPADGVALVGILRSSLGGVPDQDIMDLAKLGPLDIRRTDTLGAWDSSRKRVVTLLFERLTALHLQARRVPVAECIDQIFLQLPVLELAAVSSHREQAVRNLWKLRDLMAAQAAIPSLSFSGWVARLVKAIRTCPPEPEAAFEEESLDAVRILSIHKAKGLEFPVVVLPGLHQKSSGGDRRRAQVSVDWMSQVYGCAFPPTWNAGQVFLWEKESIREKAEQQRVLYVGMTRARDRLVLSGGQLARPVRESFLGFLQDISAGEIGNSAYDTVCIGDAGIRQTVVTCKDIRRPEAMKETLSRPDSEPTPVPFLSQAIERKREIARQQILQDRAFLNPSIQVSHANGGFRRRDRSHGADGQLIGTLMHRILEQWNFQWDQHTFREPLIDLFHCAILHDVSEDEASAILQDVEELMSTFICSSAYDELQHATILGREVPFLVPWLEEGTLTKNMKPRVMEGFIDVVYEVAGEVWVGDYKTDRVTHSSMLGYAERYRSQAEIYSRAASQALGVDVKGCKLFFLRIGEAVTIRRGSADIVF